MYRLLFSLVPISVPLRKPSSSESQRFPYWYWNWKYPPVHVCVTCVWWWSPPRSTPEKTWCFANRAPLLGTTLRGTLRWARSIFILIEDIRWTSHVRYLKYWTLPMLSSAKKIWRWLVNWRKKIPPLVDFPPPDRKSGLDLGDCFRVRSTPGVLFIETPKILTTGGCLFEKPEKMSLQIQRMASAKLLHICCHHGGLILTD